MHFITIALIIAILIPIWRFIKNKSKEAAATIDGAFEVATSTANIECGAPLGKVRTQVIKHLNRKKEDRIFKDKLTITDNDNTVEAIYRPEGTVAFRMEIVFSHLETGTNVKVRAAEQEHADGLPLHAVIYGKVFEAVTDGIAAAAREN